MTVQELINELSKVDNTEMGVNFSYSHDTQENGQPLKVYGISGCLLMTRRFLCVM